MKKILILEDDPDWGPLVVELLVRKGYDAFLSNDPRKGIALAQERKPDLILSDIMMPGMDGPEMVKLLQSSKLTQSIPVIFLTGLLDDRDDNYKERGIKVNGISYQVLAKPVDSEELLTAIRLKIPQ